MTAIHPSNQTNILSTSLYYVHNITSFRTETLGLAPQDEYLFRDIPQLCMFSETVVRRPTDWPDEVQLTGYWILPTPQVIRNSDEIYTNRRKSRDYKICIIPDIGTSYLSSKPLLSIPFGSIH